MVRRSSSRSTDRRAFRVGYADMSAEAEAEAESNSAWNARSEAALSPAARRRTPRTESDRGFDGFESALGRAIERAVGQHLPFADDTVKRALFDYMKEEMNGASATATEPLPTLKEAVPAAPVIDLSLPPWDQEDVEPQAPTGEVAVLEAPAPSVTPPTQPTRQPTRRELPVLSPDIPRTPTEAEIRQRVYAIFSKHVGFEGRGQLEHRVVSMFLDAARHEARLVRSTNRTVYSDHIDLLRRRVRKLLSAVGEVRDLVRVAHGAARVETGVESTFRTVQGLDQMDANKQAKTGMLDDIFNENLRLQKRG